MARSLRERAAGWSERNFLLYALVAYGRQLLRGREPLPVRPPFRGREEYLRDYARWQALRHRLLEKDERRLRRLVLENAGTRVHSGPFRSMSFASCRDSVSAAMMLGLYEAELHPYWEAAVARSYEVVLNPGCAFGYYAVGLARRMPRVRVVAWDLDPERRRQCRGLAEENAVGDRVEIRGAFDGAEFADFAGRRALVVCDIEGAEREALDPGRFPALRGFDVIAELHDALAPGLSEAVVERFAATHEVERVEEGRHAPLVLPEFLRSLGSVERFIAAHGGLRWGPTPWAVLTARSAGSGAPPASSSRGDPGA